MNTEFKEFPKIARLSRECIISEKLDGTNASICITEDGQFLIGSRTRWITPEADNYGFARWAMENKEELMKLGVGHHFGEWWGGGIQRGYGLQKDDKRFSLFNVARWGDVCPKCCQVVPVLYSGNSGAMWNCKCDCGNSCIRSLTYLMQKRKRSCGCSKAWATIHGHASDRGFSTEYCSWKAMISRCYNKNNNRFYRYGARGIKVCDRWRVFNNFLKDMGLKPALRLTIERINNDGNYEPSNCKWATYLEQARNKPQSTKVMGIL